MEPQWPRIFLYAFFFISDPGSKRATEPFSTPWYELEAATFSKKKLGFVKKKLFCYFLDADNFGIISDCFKKAIRTVLNISPETFQTHTWLAKNASSGSRYNSAGYFSCRAPGQSRIYEILRTSSAENVEAHHCTAKTLHQRRTTLAKQSVADSFLKKQSEIMPKLSTSKKVAFYIFLDVSKIV